MTIDDLTAEFARLTLPRFDEPTALRLGAILMEMARGKPVVINIRNAHRTFFHAALPGSQAENDAWARRKSNMAIFAGRPSMLATLQFALKGRSLAEAGLSEMDHALSGGAVPVVVRHVGMVAVATVSGLPQEEDHRLVVRAIEALMAELA